MRTRSQWDVPDQELLRRYPTDPAALEELIARYEDRVQRCARRMSLNRDEAEDLVQESFIRVLLALPSFRGNSSFGTWLYAIAHHTCVDAARHHLRAPRIEDLDTLVESRLEPVSGRSVEEEVEGQVRECFVGRAIAALPPDYRTVVRLRLAEGLSNEAAAARLGTSVESVKAKLQRARKILRGRLSQPSECPLCQGLGKFRIVPRVEETPDDG